MSAVALIPGHRLEAMEALIEGLDPVAESPVTNCNVAELIRAVRTYQVRQMLESQASMSIPEECPHLIIFDDTECEQLMFSGAGARTAALKKWEAISTAWNAHLFVRVARNSRDDEHPSAAASEGLSTAVRGQLGKIADWDDRTREAVIEGINQEIQEGCSYSWYDDALSDLLTLVEAVTPAPIAERVPQTCTWTHNTHDSNWDTGCGEKWMLNDGTPTEHGVRFCHSCGKPVAAAEMGQDAA
ncbi:hypothetical protein E6B08_17540 [Pseudomonas putida]|uniref:Uncharacterized protein n=1 Tax=Pseudomonas putida TaxID=303 RepID=A0A4D6X9H9_PSEPU|nr:hypothetical protein [Pseudomonas putida]QCI13062.1 hypothetical protein E6B08_17540 [Pseudomonas putida]